MLSSVSSCLLVLLVVCVSSVNSNNAAERVLSSYTASIGGYSVTETTIGVNDVKKFSISDTTSQGYLFEVPSKPAALKLKVTAKGAAVISCFASDTSVGDYSSSSYSASADTSYDNYDESDYESYSSSSSTSTSADGGDDDSDAGAGCVTVAAGATGTVDVPLSALKNAKVLAISLDTTTEGDSATGTVELLGPGLSPQQKALVIGLVVGVGGLLLIVGGVAIYLHNKKKRANRNVAKMQGQPVITPGQQFGQVQGYPQPVYQNQPYGGAR